MRISGVNASKSTRKTKERCHRTSGKKKNAHDAMNSRIFSFLFVVKECVCIFSVSMDFTRSILDQTDRSSWWGGFQVTLASYALDYHRAFRRWRSARVTISSVSSLFGKAVIRENGTISYWGRALQQDTERWIREHRGRERKRENRGRVRQ
jgi:hypothetical protein